MRGVAGGAGVGDEERRGELVAPVKPIVYTLDPATRTGTARVTLANSGGRLRPGMYATATLFGAASASGPVVPTEAIVRTGGEAVGQAAVIIALGEGRFRPQPVTIGEEGDGVVRVLSGLAVGDRVVTSAQFLIDSESHLKTAVSNMRDRAQGDHDSHLGG